MQVMLDGRLFPVAEASNKKVAKKDAAAATLRILLREIEGGGAEEGLTAGVDQQRPTMIGWEHYDITDLGSCEGPDWSRSRNSQLCPWYWANSIRPLTGFLALTSWSLARRF